MTTMLPKTELRGYQSSNHATENHQVEPRRPTEVIHRTWEIETLYDFATILACGLADGTIAQDEFPDSRERLDVILDWANEFNNFHSWTDWNSSEYLQEVDSWFHECLSRRRSRRSAGWIDGAA